VINSIHQNFIAGGRPEGWKPTVLGNKPLMGSGALMNSAQVSSQSDVHVEVTVGQGLPYTYIHQFGGTITAKKAPYLKFKMGDQWVSKKSVTIPARRYVRIQDEDRDQILSILSDYIINRNDESGNPIGELNSMETT